MTDFVEYIPKRHGQRPPYWTPDTLTGLDGKNYVRQPNWAWIAGTTYYVPYEAVHGRPHPAENTIITAQEMAEHYEPLLDLYGALKKIEALQAENAKLREALRRISIGDGIGGPDAELQCADIARKALQETER